MFKFKKTANRMCCFIRCQCLAANECFSLPLPVNGLNSTDLLPDAARWTQDGMHDKTSGHFTETICAKN